MNFIEFLIDSKSNKNVRVDLVHIESENAYKMVFRPVNHDKPAVLYTVDHDGTCSLDSKDAFMKNDERFPLFLFSRECFDCVVNLVSDTSDDINGSC